MVFLLLLLGLLGTPAVCAQTDARGVELQRRQLDAFRQEPRVAVVVAVDQYPEESGFRRLEFAAKDAEALAQALSGPDFNYRVRIIVNQQAVRTVIRGALEKRGCDRRRERHAAFLLCRTWRPEGRQAISGHL